MQLENVWAESYLKAKKKSMEETLTAFTKNKPGQHLDFKFLDLNKNIFVV